MNKFITYVFLIAAAYSVLGQQDSSAVAEKRIVQFTGVVFAPDSNSVIPGVHVYVPISGRGTTTNPYGFFTLPVLEGDSIVFSSIGLKRSHYIVPKHDEENSLKVIITMQEDLTLLDEVEVFPYPTEAMFKEAVLALEMPYQQQLNNMNAWINSDYMNSAYRNLPTSQNAYNQYYIEMQRQAAQGKYMSPTNNLLNPWAWAKFIKTLKTDK